MTQISGLQGSQSKILAMLQLPSVSARPPLLHDGLVDGRVMLIAAPLHTVLLSIASQISLQRTGLPEQSGVVQREVERSCQVPTTCILY